MFSCYFRGRVVLREFYFVKMGVNYLSVSAICTGVSVIGLYWWVDSAVSKIKSDGLIGEGGIHPENAAHVLELLLGSHVTVALVLGFTLNVFILLILCLKTVFFVQLYSPETRKVLECLVNYVIYKGMFLPLVVPPTNFQAALWATWLAVLCSLKMFQSLARDRLERLNASPSATPWTYFGIFHVLLLVLFIDLLWIKLCMLIYKDLHTSICLLLFFEPLSIASETVQAIMVHGLHFFDMWHHDSVDSDSDCHGARLVDGLVAGSLWEWKGILVRNVGFCLDLITLLMAIGHYLHIWWLHGMAFHFVDAVLFLILRALISAVIKRIKGFVKLNMALSSLHGALPDATMEELRTYNDECAICREPMAKAKKLSCNHLFHLACLKSWLDQGRSEVYSCPTCWRPLFMTGPGDFTNSLPGDLSSDEQLARQLSTELDHQSISGHAPMGTFPTQQQTASDSSTWRGVGLDPSWVHPWPSPGLDDAGPSTAIRSVGFGGVQMMMRHLASVGETYAHTTLEDNAWNLWPMTHPHAPSGSSIPTASSSVRYSGNIGGLRFRRTSPSSNENTPGILAMANTVREVLPHIPDDLIFQDLQRTNSVTVTVNNLLNHSVA